MPYLSYIGPYRFVVFDTDKFENRKHIHVIRGHNYGKILAKIWLEKNGKKDISFEFDNLSHKARKNIQRAIKDNWKSLMERIDKIFNGEKIGKSKFKYK